MNACEITGSYNLTWNTQWRSTAGNRQPVINGRRATCFSPEARRPPWRQFALCKHCSLCCTNKNPRWATLGHLTPKPQPHTGKIHKLESCQNKALRFVLILHCSKLGRGGRLEREGAEWSSFPWRFLYGKYNSSIIIRATAIIKAEPLSAPLVNREHRP